ncbi:MAG: SNF2-related protein [Acidimicrobiales bacterium]
MADIDILSWSPVHEAISAIAARCDGAQAPDGVGFDGSDTHFGRRVASIPVEQWTPEIAQACYELVVHKYRTQAESYGIVVANLHDPGFYDLDPSAARRHAREISSARESLIDVEAEFLTVHTAKVNWAVLDIVRAQPGRRFDSENKRWLVPVSPRAVRALLEMAGTYDIEVSAEARALVAQTGTEADEEVNDRRITLLDDGRASVFFEYDPGLVTEVKRLSGARWVGAEKYWRVGVDSQLTTFAKQHDFSIEESVVAMARKKEEATSALAIQSRSVDSDLVVPGLRGQLRPFQGAGIAYALAARRVLIGDAMGLGKTIQALGVIQAVGGDGPTKALVVCPASLKLNWLAEAIKWLGSEWKIELVTSRKAGRVGKGGSGHELVICNYDILAAREADLVAFSPRVLVADEIHAAKNKGAQRTKALDKIAKSIPDDGYVVGLSGTPVVNRPIELASPLSILGRLDDLGGFWHFAKRYCDATHNGFGWDFSGASNLEELNEVLRKTCYVRRTVHDVYDELPPVQVASVPLGMDRDIAKQYAQAERDIVTHMEERAAAVVYMETKTAADAALEEARTAAKATYDEAVGSVARSAPRLLAPPRTRVVVARESYDKAEAEARSDYDRAEATAQAAYGSVLSPSFAALGAAREALSTCVLRAESAEAAKQHARDNVAKTSAYDRDERRIGLGAKGPQAQKRFVAEWAAAHNEDTLTPWAEAREALAEAGHTVYNLALDGRGRVAEAYAEMAARSEGTPSPELTEALAKASSVLSAPFPSNEGRYEDRAQRAVAALEESYEAVAGVAQAIYDNTVADADLAYGETVSVAQEVYDKESAESEAEAARTLAAYEEARALAQATYDEALAEANARHKEVLSPAWDEYSKVAGEATSPYEVAVQARARALYEEIRTGAIAVFDETMDRAGESRVAALSGPWADYSAAVGIGEEENATSTAGADDTRQSAQAAYDEAISAAEAAHSAAMEAVGGESADAAAEAGRRAAAAEMLVRMNELRQIAARGKLRGVIEWTQNFLEAGDEKLVVFAWHKEIQEALATNLGGVAIMGGQSAAETKAAVDAFQNNPSVRLITCSLRAGSEGHTLTAAQNVAFVEEPWTPGNVAQAVARCYGRLNDPHGVVAWHLVAAGTIDEDMVDLIASKAEVTNQLADGKDAEKTTAVSGILERITKRRQGDVRTVSEQEPKAGRSATRAPQNLREMAGLEAIGASGANGVGAQIPVTARQAESVLSY